MPTRLCGTPGCPNPATVRGHCRVHATQQRKYNRSVNDAFYSSKAWKISRRAQLHDFPLCDICGYIATDVHHRTPIEAGGPKRDPANLRSLCRPCHSCLHAAMR
jgi:5-methylcytosine-specific restriction endonuclease McrA